MFSRIALLAVLAASLAACGGSGQSVKSPAAKPAPTKPAKARPASQPPALTVPRPPVRTPPPAARALTLPGLEGVIGASATELERQFGTPRLDVREGDARKVQYAATACVLDIYLYPAERGREPVATYVDARRASDGQDVDRAACVAALRERPAQ